MFATTHQVPVFDRQSQDVEALERAKQKQKQETNPDVSCHHESELHGIDDDNDFQYSRAPEAHKAHYFLGCAVKGCAVELCQHTVDSARHESLCQMSSTDISATYQTSCKKHRRLTIEQFLHKRVPRGSYITVLSLARESRVQFGDAGFAAAELVQVATTSADFQVFSTKQNTQIGNRVPKGRLERIIESTTNSADASGNSYQSSEDSDDSDDDINEQSDKDAPVHNLCWDDIPDEIKAMFLFWAPGTLLRNLRLSTVELRDMVDAHHEKSHWGWIIETNADIRYEICKRLLSRFELKEADEIYRSKEKAKKSMEWVHSVSILFHPIDGSLAVDDAIAIMKRLSSFGLRDRIVKVSVSNGARRTLTEDDWQQGGDQRDGNFVEDREDDEWHYYTAWLSADELQRLEQWFHRNALHWKFWRVASTCKGLEAINLDGIALRNSDTEAFPKLRVKSIRVANLLDKEHKPFPEAELFEPSSLLCMISTISSLERLEIEGLKNLPSDFFTSIAKPAFNSSRFRSAWHLRELAVRKCEFKAAPEVDLEQFDFCGNLRELDLSGNRIARLHGIGAAKSLALLALEKCNLARVVAKSILTAAWTTNRKMIIYL